MAGLAMGVLPGLGGTAAVGIILPFAIVLEPQQSLPLLIGAVAVVHHSDVITAILLKVPGSASAAVIMPDGNALARKGQAARAFAVCFMASMFGGVLGAIGLTFSIPIAEPLVLAFGSPELFMLTVLGISLAALLSQGNVLKGVVAGTLGLLVGMIGAAPAAPEYRYTFGMDALLDGIGLIPLALGFFGLAEIAHMIAKKTAVAERLEVGGGWLRGAKETLHHWRLILRGALVGMWAGVLPGLGATAGTYMAYGQAAATVNKKERKKFGKGDPRGLVAAESSVNSVEAGDLIPTLLFGIPGGAPAALLLGALLAYGIQPGPAMVTDHLDIMYTIVWSFALASVLGSILCFFLVKPLAQLSHVKFQYLAPALLIVMFVASFQTAGQFGGLIAMLGLGVFGFLMKLADFPRAPFLIGFILSVPMERYYFLTTEVYTASEWLTRPFVLVMFGILLLPLAFMGVRWLRARRATSEGTMVDDEALGDDDEGDGLGFERSRWPVVLAVFTLATFVAAWLLAVDYQPRAQLMPQFVSVIGIVLAALLVGKEVLAVLRKQRTAPFWTGELSQTMVSFGWLVLFLVLVNYLGFLVASAIFVPLFLWRVGRLKIVPLAIYTTVAVAVLVLAYTSGTIDMPAGLWLPVIPWR